MTYDNWRSSGLQEEAFGQVLSAVSAMGKDSMRDALSLLIAARAYIEETYVGVGESEDVTHEKVLSWFDRAIMFARQKKAVE